jgi:uncharacterized protein YggE
VTQPLPALHALTLLAALALAAPAAAQDASRLLVTGEGRVASAPDMAVLRLGVEARASEADAALGQVSQAATAVLEALRAEGIAEADIRTSELRLGQRYDDGRSAGGFEAANVVTARVRDLGALGAVIDAASSAGANRIEGLRFSLADEAPAMAEARRRAVADARAAADTLAEAAGLTLGPVLRLREGGGPGVPGPMADMMRAEAASVPIASGDIDTTARVSIVYRVVPAD